VIRYKSYKDALVLGSKGNSTAGCSAEQIAANKTSLLMLQQKRCPCFDAFDEVFSSTPNVKPIYPIEIGAIGDDGDEEPESQRSDNIHDRICDPTPPPAVQEVPVRAGASPPDRGPPPPPPAQVLPSRASTAAGGKSAAAFHLAPSKKEKKMDLGEAYLKAQQSRVESQAASAQAKNRTDLVIALTLQGKTAVEITGFLTLLD
jgi:hypothetical protein